VIDVKAERRKTLAHCLSMAESDEIYARWAASEYERNEIYGGLFTGLRARFDTDWSRMKADRAKEQVVA
jgi:hypothetical protein